MHNGHLVVDGVKMSKSLNNFFTLNDLLERGLSPALLRLELLRVHYRAKLDFRPEELTDSKQLLSKIDFALTVMKSPESGTQEGQGVQSVQLQCDRFVDAVRSALADDLNIALVWAALNHFLSFVNKPGLPFSSHDKEQLLDTFRFVDSVLGIEKLVEFEKSRRRDEIPESLKLLADERSAARQMKDFARADTIRAKILAAGFDVKDTPTGVEIFKIS
jgi:cysteinyl-tRNA synthetase